MCLTVLLKLLCNAAEEVEEVDQVINVKEKIPPSLLEELPKESTNDSEQIENNIQTGIENHKVIKR